MKIYTKTGDTGITSRYDGCRIPKCSTEFMTIGEIDELSSRIGMLCTMVDDCVFLRKIQCILQDFNSYIATKNHENKKLPPLDDNWVTELEDKIDFMESENIPLTKFILPGVNIDDAQAHLCRTQTRKAERMIVKMFRSEEPGRIPIIILTYMNRLSDFFFVFARWKCLKNGSDDISYH